MTNTTKPKESNKYKDNRDIDKSLKELSRMQKRILRIGDRNTFNDSISDINMKLINLANALRKLDNELNY